MKEILSEQTVFEKGFIRVVERYYQGRHPSLGTLIPPHKAWSGGWETKQRLELVKPIHTFSIEERGRTEDG